MVRDAFVIVPQSFMGAALAGASGAAVVGAVGGAALGRNHSPDIWNDPDL
jgi:hypothetical protein